MARVRGSSSRSDASRSTSGVTGPFLRSHEIYHAVRDLRSGRIFAAANTPFWGPDVVHSDDSGESWNDSATPPRFATGTDDSGGGEGDGPTVQHVWNVTPGRTSEPGVVYAGVEPAALFRSDDNGLNWAEMGGLRAHPSAERWEPGNGGLCLHTIVLDPDRPGRMYAGISAAGVFRSDDGGETWSVKNDGITEVLPAGEHNIGRCPHKFDLDPADPEVIYLHGHTGVFRSDDGADQWHEAMDGLPSQFGFALTVHPRQPGTLYVVPMFDPEFRVAPEGRFRVFRTTDDGRKWEPLSNGLPQHNAYLSVLREGLTNDGADEPGIYVGAKTGQVFYSTDGGDEWRC